MGKYTSVSCLSSQKREIQELIFQKDWLGYRRDIWRGCARNPIVSRNVAEFVRAAIRTQLDRDKMQLSSQEKEREKDLY